jgi:hypothetical protein
MTTKDIEMVKTSYKLNSNNEFEVEEQETRMIDDEWYNNIIEAKQFFLNLGGQEIHKKKQTKRGRKVVQVISISPDSTMKSIYDFKFN